MEAPQVLVDNTTKISKLKMPFAAEAEEDLVIDVGLSRSSSCSTVPSCSPVEDLTKAALLDKDEDEATSELKSPSFDGSSISTQCSTDLAIASVLGFTDCIAITPLLCGSYDLNASVGLTAVHTVVASASVQRSIATRECSSALVTKLGEDLEEGRENVTPLPEFYATRFRTLVAERWAQPSLVRQTDHVPFSDWYSLLALWSTASPASTSQWKGHLRLGPEQPSTAWKIRRIRRKCKRYATSLPKSKTFSPIHAALVQDITPSSHRSRKPIRPLPIISVNRPGQEDFEMVFLSNEDQSDTSISSDKTSKASLRRPPASTSITPSQALDKNATKQSKSPKSGGTMDFDTVQVRTPGADRSALKELPALRDAPPTKREELFIMKLKLCSVIFSFDDPTADKRGKDMKRQTLLELVDYVNTPAGQKIFTESVMADLMAMVSANVCRALPPATDDFDPEEDEPVLEPAWPHLQVAYEFFLRFIVSSEVNAKAAKKYVDQKFCLQLVELFDSEDPRERDYLKTILHRIYGKFMSHRSFIRRAISNVFYRFVYETERHNGVGELLEILGSIINGFAIPLKKEHLQFLVRALIPLHKPKCVALYHQQLSYCIIQYVEKDADTATPILNGFFKCWPWSSSAKQVMFLNELEEILELLGADQLAQVSTMLFTNLARCLDSDHFQVVERALFLWNNEHLVNSGCLSRLNAQTVLPIIYRPLYKNSAGHWNATVEGLAQNVLKMYMEYDLVLYDKCTKAYYREEEEAKRKLEALEQQWSAVEATARSNMPAITAK